jgi:hypothetical protein
LVAGSIPAGRAADAAVGGLSTGGVTGASLLVPLAAGITLQE